MSIPPPVVDTMTLWELNVSWRGWRQVHMPDSVHVPPPTSAEFYDMVKRLGH